MRNNVPPTEGSFELSIKRTTKIESLLSIVLLIIVLNVPYSFYYIFCVQYQVFIPLNSIP